MEWHVAMLENEREREREREREQPPWGPWATSLTWGSIIHKLSQSYGYTFTLVRSLFPVLELNGHKNVFLLFCYYLPKGQIVEPSMFEIGLMVLQKRIKMWKVYRQTIRQWTTCNQKKLSWALQSSNLLKTGQSFPSVQ